MSDQNTSYECPVCAVPMKDGDVAATDIELGTCHAACLEGSPTVDLDTGEPTNGSIHTFKYSDTEEGVRKRLATSRL